MRVGIFSNTKLTRKEMVIKVRKSPQMAGAFLADDVSTTSTYVVPAIGEKKFTVLALDMGIKGATPRSMSQRGIEVHVMPSKTTFKELIALNPDGIFLSNGPGDPATMTEMISLVQEILAARIPLVLSSITIQFATGVPDNLAACSKIAGCGLEFGKSSPETKWVK